MSIMPIFNTRTRNSCEPTRNSYEPTRNSYDPFSRDTRDPYYNEYHFGSAMKAPHSHSQSQYSHPQPHVISQHHHHASESLANAKIEWKEVPEAYFIRTELPGIRREDVKVVVEDDKLLKISGQRSVDYEDSQDNYWHHVERSTGRFMTAFMLPEDARPDQVRSTMENGVLNITVPKRMPKHHVRAVEVVV